MLTAPSAARAEAGVHRNEKFGYGLAYPDGWWPSGIAYANAFDLRNYDPKKPGEVAESDRATLMIVDTMNENATITNRFLDGLMGGGSSRDHEHRELTIDGHRAVSVRKKMPAARLGRGAKRALPAAGSNAPPGSLWLVATYIADGRHVVALEASVSVEANPKIVEEIEAIARGVRFDAVNQDAERNQTQGEVP